MNIHSIPLPNNERILLLDRAMNFCDLYNGIVVADKDGFTRRDYSKAEQATYEAALACLRKEFNAGPREDRPLQELINVPTPQVQVEKPEAEDDSAEVEAEAV